MVKKCGVAIVLLLGACTTGAGPMPVGTYVLNEVDESSLPVSLSRGRTILADTITVEPTGRYRRAAYFQITAWDTGETRLGLLEEFGSLRDIGGSWALDRDFTHGLDEGLGSGAVRLKGDGLERATNFAPNHFTYARLR
ncbi:MAG: hypothetical protein AAF389_02890 [Gemmatimonadota bacterium]